MDWAEHSSGVGSDAAGSGADRAAPQEIDRLVAALQDPTRRQILFLLVRDGLSRTVDEVAGLVGVHRTVAFDHLERLAKLGYLLRSKRRGRVGKPATLYAASSRSLSAAYPARRFAMLASLLAGGLADLGPEGADAARGAGRRLGAQLATGATRSMTDAVRALAPLGAEYTVEAGDRVLNDGCIFLEACAAAPDVVCGLHAGILEGVLRGSGFDAHVEPVGAVSPSACAFSVAVRNTDVPDRDGRSA